MPEFLQTLVFDNPLIRYLWIAGILLAMFLLKGIVSKFLCGLLYGFFPGAKKYVTRDQFIALVLIPMEWFVVWMVVIFSFHKLNFPSVLDVELYKITSKEIIEATGKAILVVFFIRLLRRFIDFIALVFKAKADQTPDQSDNQLVVFFRDFFKVVAIIIGIIMFSKFVFNFDISSLITGLSIVTAAVALATRESLENLIASFIIFFDKPFTLGDLVKVEGVTGTVEKIGLRSTRIRTEQKTFLTMPNKKMVDSILDNLTLRTQRKAEIRLELHVRTTAKQIDELIAKIEMLLQQQEEIVSSTVVLNDVGSKSIIIHVDYFTQTIEFARFQEIKQTINLNILRMMEGLGIELAGNQP
ncbi:mechanosensitive ion channel family protein [Lacibacter sp.]|uniref:mechanosensitive ion channel family protein n=1 Tax=Lacibacter sp. TaxID=1915409 RepID=UPI002B4AB5C3|nr:mechanosensitive ion channel domain-containing protein [Lacibacter sp.]HLP37364.1 mechanosensitive ion channel domain-containing protein [Lacibacter sp.]